MYLTHTHTHTHTIIIFTIAVHTPPHTDSYGFVMHYSVANRNRILQNRAKDQQLVVCLYMYFFKTSMIRPQYKQVACNNSYIICYVTFLYLIFLILYKRQNTLFRHFIPFTVRTHTHTHTLYIYTYQLLNLRSQTQNTVCTIRLLVYSCN